MVDIYIPRKQGHAAIRIRQQGEKFFITKKTEVIEQGHKTLKEETIEITEEDFDIFKSMQNAKILDKTRYYLPLDSGLVMELDVFSGDLTGLVLGEVEFDSIESLKSFQTPDFCLSDVSNEDSFAGGVLFKLSYSDLEPILDNYGYQKI
jgi:CYTH domain-containing protein